MLDYRPNILEENRKTSKHVTGIKFLETAEDKNSKILKSFYDKLEFNSTSNVISKLNNLKEVKTDIQNDYISENELNNFGDILNYESQNDRITSVIDELKEIEETLSIMMYGDVVSLEKAKEKDTELFKILKDTDKANNTNLINLSKMLIIINEYINSIEKHVEGISYINMEISEFTKLDNKNLVLSDLEINSIQLSDKTNLKNSQYVADYISKKSVINSHMIKLYNDIVDYNLCLQAINKLNTDNNINKSFIYDKENAVKKSFLSFIKTIEYSNIQSEEYLKSLRLRFDGIKDLYI